MVHELDYLRRTIAGLAGYYIPRTGTPRFIGASPTNAGPFFIAMHALYIAALTNLDATEIQVRTRAADAIWQKLPLPKDVNSRWLAIRKRYLGR